MPDYFLYPKAEADLAHVYHEGLQSFGITQAIAVAKWLRHKVTFARVKLVLLAAAPHPATMYWIN